MNKPRHEPMPLLEWIAAGLGLAVTLGLVGFVGWQAFTASNGGELPHVVVETGAIEGYDGGWVIEITARNLSARTAAGVVIEGTLRQEDRTLQSTVTLDYLAGDSTRKAGLFMPADPRSGEFTVRAGGYVAP